MDVRQGLRQLASRPGSHLLPLRAFLGVTFTFAGLQKLANPAFFRASSPTSIQAQLADAHASSPIHALVGIALHAPVPVGVLISVGELAVGLGTLAGLLTRWAAAGGTALSLSFFLTVSYHTAPYYYGADIVFVFAWTAIALQGPTVPSLDVLLRTRAAGPPAAVPAVRDPARGTQRRGVEIDRRHAMARGVLAGAGAVVTLALGGIVAAVGRALAAPAPRAAGGGGTGGSGGSGGHGPGTITPGSSTVAEPKGTKIGLASAVPVGGAASFTDPASGQPAFVVQPSAGTFAAFSAICTHEGCTVAFRQATETFNCPCHGSIYNARTGAVEQGPAPAPLPSIPLELGPGDALYADG